MLSAINRAAGGNFCFPDVCNTPVGPSTAPIPYPNISLSMQAFPFCIIVRVSYVNAINMGSSIPLSSGDEPGVAHPMVKAAGKFSMGCIKVFFEKLPAIHLTNPTTGNNMNAPAGAVTIPSVTNVFLTDVQKEHVLNPDSAAPNAGWRAVTVSRKALEELSKTPSGTVSQRLLGDDVGYVHIPHFSVDTPSRMHRALERLQAAGATSVVIDLRGNPGGELDAARRAAEELLPRGAVIVRVVAADGDETVYRSRHEGRTDLPLWLWVDGETASAAEVFAGCLQQHGRARVIGETSYGKGRGQVARHTVDGLVYADVFRCSLPDGTPLGGRGVIPDVAYRPHRRITED